MTIMPTTIDFFTIGRWMGILTIVFAVLAVLGFIFKWGIRFRLVGVTGFMGVLTGGLFSLYLGLSTHTTIPGAVRYSVVYDNGASQVVIAVSPQIAESELEATLRQAASDLYSFGRLGQVGNQMTIRARTIIHPESGVSKPLYLGQVRRSLASREDEQMQIDIYPENLAQLPKTAA